MGKKKDLQFEAFVLQKKIEIEMLITERVGMIVENRQRELADESLAYTEDNFTSIRKAMLTLCADLIRTKDAYLRGTE